MHVGLDHGAVLVGAIVIGGDAARAVVHAFAHCGIAQIGQVVGLAACSHGGIFYFHKVADVHRFPQLGARAQPCKWANQRALSHTGPQFFAVNMGEGVDHRAIGNLAVRDHTVRTNAHVVAQRDRTLKETVHVNLDILPAGERSTHIKAGWITQAHPLLQQLIGLAALVFTLQFGQLLGAVHPRHLHRIINAMRHHGHAVSHRELDHVGEVVLFFARCRCQFWQASP